MKAACTLAMLVPAAVGWSAQPTYACSCDRGEARLFPTDGSTSVPTNVLPTVYSPYLSTGDLTLRRASDERVVLSFTTTRRRHPVAVAETNLIVVHPDGPLDAMTDYELLDGDRVLTRFRTGNEADDRPPAPPPLSHLRIETMELDSDGASCGPAGSTSRLRTDYPGLAAGSSYLLLELHAEQDGGWTEDWLLLSEPEEVEPLAVDPPTCGANLPPLHAGQRYCARIIEVDAAGNESQSAMQCTVAVNCLTPLNDDGYPLDICFENPGIFHTDGSGCSTTSRYGPHGLAILLALTILVRVNRRSSRH